MDELTDSLKEDEQPRFDFKSIGASKVAGGEHFVKSLRFKLDLFI
jgi:hypothetical protein